MVEDYLRSGTVEEFRRLFSKPSAVRWANVRSTSSVAKSYVFTDIVLATARFVDELGGNADQVVPELGNIEAVLAAHRDDGTPSRAARTEVLAAALSLQRQRL